MTPSPEFTNNPPINVPIPITPLTNNSVKTTDDAQFGIRPTIPAITGPSIGLFNISPAKTSSPTVSKTKFNKSDMININKKLCIIPLANRTKIIYNKLYKI